MGRGEKTLSLGLPSKLYWNDTQIWSGKSKKKKKPSVWQWLKTENDYIQDI